MDDYKFKLKLKILADVCLQIQNASNLPAVLRTWVENYPLIRAHADREGLAHEYSLFNIMFLSKVTSLMDAKTDGIGDVALGSPCRYTFTEANEQMKKYKKMETNKPPLDSLHQQRLLNVAKALRESYATEIDMNFMLKPESMALTTQEKMHKTHWCGTPSCALGHYASRPDLQNKFFVRGRDVFSWLEGDKTTAIAFSDLVVQDHFGIDSDEATELFGSDGCDDAKTPEDAAKYIEEFVERRSKPQPNESDEE